MPTINLGRKKKRDYIYTSSKKSLHKWYNNLRWKKLRACKFKADPLCEVCLKKDPEVIRQADEIHHIIPIDPDNPDPGLIYDYDNLLSVCYECHSKIHNPKPVSPYQYQPPER